VSDRDPQSPFGHPLRNYLHVRIKQSGLKPAEIARRAGIVPALLYRFLNDQRDLSLETIDKILPVIDGEIESRMKQVVEHTQELVAQQKAMFDAMARLQSQEGAIESAILGLQEVMEALLAIRNATGSDFSDAMGL